MKRRGHNDQASPGRVRQSGRNAGYDVKGDLMQENWNEINDLKPCFELDALIGSDVMHTQPEWMWNVVNPEGTATCFSGDSKAECEHWLADLIQRCPGSWLKNYHVDKWPRWPRYSTDISAAWQVVEKMRKSGFDVSIWAYGSPCKVRVTIESSNHGPQFSFKADTAPEAICKAALMVVSN